MTTNSQLIGSTPGLPVEKVIAYNDVLSLFFDNMTIIGTGTNSDPFRVDTSLFMTQDSFATQTNPLVTSINSIISDLATLAQSVPPAFDITQMPGFSDAPLGARLVVVKLSGSTYELQEEEAIVVAASFNADGEIYFVADGDMTLKLSSVAGTGNIIIYNSTDGGLFWNVVSNPNTTPFTMAMGNVIKITCSGTTSFLSLTIIRVG